MKNLNQELKEMNVKDSKNKNVEEKMFEYFLVQDEKSSNLKPRGEWKNSLDFLMTLLGFSIGLGNIWRFPYLCYKHGGGAFFIPYFVSLIFAGIPVFFLEVSLGQYMGQGGIRAWKICPILQGIGYGTTVIVFLLNTYYPIVLSWACLYLFYSFRRELPWSRCNNEWNDELCVSYFDVPSANLTENATYVDATVQFWERKILHLSPDINTLGKIQWDLAACLLLVWLAVYFCVWKGVKVTGKIVYFTGTFPFILLTILLIRGVTLEGAIYGIKYYIKPDFSKLANSQVWIDAGTQIFFSYSLSLGTMTSLGSYNAFNNNCFRDCWIFSFFNTFTSIYGGFAIFSVLGYMATVRNIPIEKVAVSGPGLAFVVYPRALTTLPASSFWSALFFINIFFLGLDSQFVGLEGFITAIVDICPKLRKGHRREIFIACVCFLCFLLGLTMVTEGGIYIFQIFDFYAASGICLLVFAFFEAVGIAYFFGYKNFYSCVELMLGKKISPFWRIAWSFLTPLFTCGLLIFYLIKYEPLLYNDEVVYPSWAYSLGWCLASSSIICIPLYAIISILKLAINKSWLSDSEKEDQNFSITKILKKLTVPCLKWHQIPHQHRSES